jgi:hypothetical protein
MPSKRSARIDCRSGSFWVTPKIFWRWVREGVIEFDGEHPLSGRYKGRAHDFQVSLNHIILDLACPEHLHEVLQSQRRLKDCR